MTAERAFRPRESEPSSSGPEQEKRLETPPLDALEKDLVRVQNYEYFFKLIADGTITTLGELRARLAPRFNRDGLLIDASNNPVISGNSYIVERSIRGKTIEDPEQQKLFEELYLLTQGDDVPSEIKQNMIRYFKGGDETARTRTREAMVAGGVEDKWEKRVFGLMDAFTKLERKNTLEKKFYDAIQNPGSYGELLTILSSSAQMEEADLQLVKQLVDEAIVRRRLDVSVAFAAALAQPTLDFDAALRILRPLGESKSPEDVATARLLADNAYQAEIARVQTEVEKQLTLDADPRQVLAYINAAPVRPTVDATDYLEKYKDIRETAEKILLQIQRSERRKRANGIRRTFPQAAPEAVLGQIEQFPAETVEEIATKRQLFDLYQAYVAAERPAIFDSTFKSGIAAKMEKALRAEFVSADVGRNKEAFRSVRETFRRTVFLLGEAFRDDPRTKEITQAVFRPVEVNGERKAPTLRYIQRITELEKQRPLTDTERMYLQSVELLSLFNPYLVAIANADPGIAQEYLNHHFEKTSRKTLQNLSDGDYVPLVQVGLGPNGLAALGEVTRNNAALAEHMLVIDEGELPGGPFAVPRGPAWELNSANARGGEGVTLPAAPSSDELKTVRAYGSPVTRWFPGERQEGKDTRQGSINTTVDYLLSPDNISTARYPTNEELHLVLSLQAALLAKRMALQTRVVKVEPNPNKDEQGDKIVTLETRQPDGTIRTLRLKTDALFIGSGLGEASYGFNLEGSRAEKIVEASKKSKKFPKISTTLDAFRALSERSREKKSPGKTLVIWGGGNSADTLIENIGSIFQGDNPRVREVTKVYVITNMDLSARPRYSMISDLKPRNGRGNLIEFVKARVSDVDYAPGEGKADDRQLEFFNAEGRAITDADGQPIRADSAVAAAGFRPEIDSVLAPYLGGRSLKETGKDSQVDALTLPTNSDVSVADVLKADPTIMLYGTASKPRFDSVKKLEQLPREAREALLRNGAENAVAIGFRAPDTQAAVNIWMNTREISVPEEGSPVTTVEFEATGDVAAGTEVSIPMTLADDERGVPNNINADTLMLSSLLSYEVGNQLQLKSGEGGFTGEFTFQIRYDEGTKKFTLQFVGGSAPATSLELFRTVENAVSDTYFQRYALSALGKRRRNPKLEVGVAFREGKIDPRKTYVQE